MYIEGTIKSIGTIAEFLYVMLTWACSLIRIVSSMVQEVKLPKRLNESENRTRNKKQNPNKSIINGSISSEM
jgi:hypothetical protein